MNSKTKVADNLAVKIKTGQGERVVVTGEVRIKHIDSKGNVKSDTVHNAVTSQGYTHIASEMAGGSDPITQIGVGIGTGGTTALNSETLKKNLDGGYPSSAAAVVTYRTTFDPGEATAVLTEAGLFTAGPIMVCYVDNLNYDKKAGDTLEYTWTMTYQSP